MILTMSDKSLRTCLALAWEEATKSTCLKKKVGAVLYSTSYRVVVGKGNGHPKVPCDKCVRKELTWTQDGCWSVHSEVQALFNYFEVYGYKKNLSQCIMVVTHGPCDQCLKYMDHFNIQKVYYDQGYKEDDYSKWKGRISVEKIKLEDKINDTLLSRIPKL